MVITIIICAIGLICAICGLYFGYQDAKKNKNKLREFKKELLIGAVFSVIILALVGSCLGCNDNNYRNEQIDRGYTSDPNYKPTFDSRGKYHNNGTGDKQIQYQGSREQRNDLDAIDRYAKDHPGF
jgi:hypothetical protein